MRWTTGGDPEGDKRRWRRGWWLIGWIAIGLVAVGTAAGMVVVTGASSSRAAKPHTVTEAGALARVNAVAKRRPAVAAAPRPHASSERVRRHPQVVEPTAGVVASPASEPSSGAGQAAHRRMPPPLPAPPLGPRVGIQLHRAYAELRLQRAYASLGSLGSGFALSRGGVNFDGHVVAGWIAPILSWARAHGWGGSVTSGYRSFSQQAALYARYRAGGNIAAVPGESNHEKLNYPGGAVDVSEPAQLNAVLRGYPRRPNLVWGGPVIGDQVHFSATGR